MQGLLMLSACILESHGARVNAWEGAGPLPHCDGVAPGVSALLEHFHGALADLRFGQVFFVGGHKPHMAERIF